MSACCAASEVVGNARLVAAFPEVGRRCETDVPLRVWAFALRGELHDSPQPPRGYCHIKCGLETLDE